MRIAIIGAALQGMELVYLAGKAGYETLVIDRRADAPALSLADGILVADVMTDGGAIKEALSGCDAAIPANENLDALDRMAELCGEMGIPYLFDPKAYRISCSKRESNRIMSDIGISMPEPWPQCGFPAIVKPSSFSGSIGVKAVENMEEFHDQSEVVRALGDEVVAQEYVTGKNISIEVIGNGEDAISFVTTEVHLDKGYDCKMVSCNPRIVDPVKDGAFGRIGAEIAKAIGLDALMDVEAIVHDGVIKVLEIDARFPSQTPAAIYHATGVNLLERLVASKLRGELKPVSCMRRYSIYEHISVDGGAIITHGEKRFSKVRNPRIIEGFFGCDEAITDYEPGRDGWTATLMTSADSLEGIVRRRQEYITRIMNECNLHDFIDESPDVVA